MSACAKEQKYSNPMQGSLPRSRLQSEPRGIASSNQFRFELGLPYNPPSLGTDGLLEWKEGASEFGNNPVHVIAVFGIEIIDESADFAAADLERFLVLRFAGSKDLVPELVLGF